MLRLRRKNERGATAVIVAVTLVLVFVGAAFAADIGVLTLRRQGLRDALDAGALAGAAMLPDDPTAAASEAIDYTLANYDGLKASDITVAYRCMVADRDENGFPDPDEVPGVCDPGFKSGSGFACDRGVCSAICAPGRGHLCNVLVLESKADVGFAFAPVIGASSGSTGTVRVGACAGGCGSASRAPLDFGIIIDRTRSMSDSDLANVKAAAESILQYLDPQHDHLALGVIHRSSTTSRCSNGGYGISITTTDYNANRGTWIAAPYPSGLSSDYLRSDGSVNGSSRLVQAIRCLQHSSFSTTQGQTDIGNPLQAVTDRLISQGRPGVKKAIMLMTDGEANLPTGQPPCGYAYNQAVATKAAKIELFTVGFGIDDKQCNRDPSGTPYYRVGVPKLLADMATQPSVANGCDDAENEDGDHYFCEPRSGDLTDVFVRVVTQVTGRPRLVRLPS